MARRICCLLVLACFVGVVYAEKPLTVRPDVEGEQVSWATAIGEPGRMVVDGSHAVDLKWEPVAIEFQDPQPQLPRSEVAGATDVQIQEFVDGTTQMSAPLKVLNNGLDINGSISYLVGGGVLEFWADEVANTRTSGTSGSLKLQLWATSVYPVFGNTITGTVLGSYDLNPLPAGWQYNNIYSGTLPFNAPPTGCWWITMMLVEYRPPWEYQDLRTFDNQQDFSTGACGTTCYDDTWEEDDVCLNGNQIQVGGSQTHKHCDQDWVWFNAIQGQTYTIETSALIGGADTIIDLYSDCGPFLASDDDGGPGLGSRIVWTATTTGILDIKISEFQGDYQNGMGYNISVTGGGGGGGGGGGACVYNAGTLYLHNGRFRITGAAFSGGIPSTFFLQSLCPNGVASQTAAAFYFNSSWPPVQEGFVSVRDGCSFSRHAYIVEVASASTRKFYIDVTDTWTGLSHRYQNPTGGSSTFFPADATSFQGSCP